MYDVKLKEEYIKLEKEVDKQKKVLDNKVKEAKEKFQNSCNHRDEKGEPTIKYNSSYEQRSNDMYCCQCHKYGTKKELIGE